MMQPTPAPTSPASSPKQTDATLQDEDIAYPPPPQNMNSAPFGVLAGLFGKLQNERNSEKRRRLIGAWFNRWREQMGYDLYPVLRLILPHKDKERAVYGLKEKNLAKTYIKLIPLNKNDPDAIRLMNWKRPSERDKTSGDFPAVLYDVVSKRSSVVEGNLTVDELNDILDELSKNSGKQEAQSKILQRVYNRTTPEEQRWIIRIILKDLIISVKETTVFSVFHPDAMDLFNTCSDLKKVAYELWDTSRRLKEEDKGVQIFRAFAPMLCKRPTHKIEESVKEMQGHTFIIEEKLDGERMQLHKRGNEYFYCSRKGKDYTYLYGQNVGAGSLTPFIDSAFDSRVDDIILDGEMLVWDPVSERNLPFGTLKTAALDKSKKQHNPRPCFKVFDMVYLNGRSLLNKSTKVRKNNMRRCVREIKGRIEFTIEFEGRTAKDVRERMDDVMAERGEGLVIKHPKSEYVLNGRNKDWIKVKPEYMDNMGETVDVLVVAGNYGSGKRGGGVSTLICGVLDDRRKNDDDELKYSSFVRIGSGLSFADYVWVREKPWKVWDPKDPPAFLQTAKKSHEDKGDVYLEPEDSFIVKVKAAEITHSDQYHMGLTMRFPRALSIRDDLDVSDCMTATAVLASMRTDRKRKMETDAGMSKKKRKTVAKLASLGLGYEGMKQDGSTIESDIFKDMIFTVSSDPKSKTGDQDKAELVKQIRKHGGKTVMVAKNHPDLIVIYDGKTTPYDISLVIRADKYDVVKPRWIQDSIAQSQRVPLQKKYFFHATSKRKQAEGYDSDTEDEDEDVAPAGTPMVQSRDNTPQEVDDTDTKSDDADETDPSLKDWYKVDKQSSHSPPQDSDTETEDDSDHDAALAGADGEDAAEDDWLQVENEPADDSSKDEPEDIKMGESETAMEYDQDLIFKHLCFYLDSPENARKQGMPVKVADEQAVNASFDALNKVIVENGGRVVDLDEPKLTHTIIDKRDSSRRLELTKRTSVPKRRRVVLTDFIEACLEEQTLLDEEDFAP
ncbi:hypothetical protein PLICRDRAFT_55380 [Plicaturopsis crispa FD-325 SS-3]|nr:hypothetical protein PLICRDRAFT_55380 [Plicaturopsis crispa FD-325 SS-3]